MNTQLPATRLTLVGGQGMNAHAHIITPLGESPKGCRSDKEVLTTTMVSVIQSPHALPEFQGRIDVMTAIQGGNYAWMPVTTIEVL